MAFRLYVVFDDHRDLVGEPNDLAAACAAAIELSDDLGRRRIGERHPPPVRVDVYDAARLEISIRIFPGGLLPSDAIRR